MPSVLQLRRFLGGGFLDLLDLRGFLLALGLLGGCLLLQVVERSGADLLTLGAVVLGNLAAGDVEGDGGAEGLAGLSALAESGADLAPREGLGHRVVHLDALAEELVVDFGMAVLVDEAGLQGGFGDGDGAEAPAVEAEVELLLAAVLVGHHEGLGADVADILLVLLSGLAVGDGAGLQQGVDDALVLLGIELVGEAVVEDHLEVVTLEAVVGVHLADGDPGVEDPLSGFLVLHAAGNELHGLLRGLRNAGDLDGVGEKVGGLAGGKLLGDLGIGFHEGTRNLER